MSRLLSISKVASGAGLVVHQVQGSRNRAGRVEKGLPSWLGSLVHGACSLAAQPAWRLSCAASVMRSAACLQVQVLSCDVVCSTVRYRESVFPEQACAQLITTRAGWRGVLGQGFFGGASPAVFFGGIP